MTSSRFTAEVLSTGKLSRSIRALFLYGGLALLALAGVRFMSREATKYVEWTAESYQRFWPQRWWLATHVLTASIALTVAPLQFIPVIRRRWPRFHRTIGWAYVLCALISAPAMLRLASLSDCPMCITPFSVWAIVFIFVTIAAIVMAVQRRFDQHRQFMVRSWVLMNGFVFLRIDHDFPYPLIPTGPGVHRAALLLWVIWVVPFVITEMWLSWGPQLTRRKAPARARAEGTPS